MFVASTDGETAYEVLEVFKGFRVIIDATHCGYREPFESTMPDDIKTDLENKGAVVVTASHALSGTERSILQKHSGIYPLLLIGDTLKLFGQA